LSYRQKALKFTEQHHYVLMAKRRGWSAENVLLHAARRMRALEHFKIAKSGRTEEYLGLANPFIEDHGWKFMVRESLRNMAKRETWKTKQNQSH
jgi:hypothetical protein